MWHWRIVPPQKTTSRDEYHKCNSAGWYLTFCIPDLKLQQIVLHRPAEVGTEDRTCGLRSSTCPIILLGFCASSDYEPVLT
jgi:hypothetical protein